MIPVGRVFSSVTWYSNTQNDPDLCRGRGELNPQPNGCEPSILFKSRENDSLGQQTECNC